MQDVPAATGPYMVPLAKMADMMAAAPSVQTRFEAADAAEALQRIHFPALEEERIAELMPLVVLGPGDRWDWDTASGGAQNYMRPSGSIMLLLALTSPFPALEAATRDVGNFVGALVKDLAAEAAKSNQLAIGKMRQIFPPSLCSKEHEATFGRYFLAGYYVDWD